ncbi:MAG: MgtC/SapB family protein [Thermoproteota archaeon]|nr:MgtC/SapB family protein [Thermoproteota archaeon]MDQ3969513.1 MgtC/SapB family protein [Thermoproteota archaeon]
MQKENQGISLPGLVLIVLVIGGAMIFTFLSSLVVPNSTSRIALQVVSGIGFLGAGIILKSEIDKKITNLTTAAAIWYAAAIGYEYYFLAAVATAFAVGVPRIPHISKCLLMGDELKRLSRTCCCNSKA